MCNALISLNKSGMPAKSEEKENVLRNLRYADNLNKDFKPKTKEGQNINTWIEQIETALFNQFFKTDINRLDATTTSETTNEILQHLNEKISATPCKLCREQSMESIKKHYERLEVLYRKEKLNEYLTIVMNVESEMPENINKLRQIKGNVATMSDSATLEHETTVQKASEIEQNIKLLENMIKTKTDDKSVQEISLLNERILQIVASVKEGFAYIRKNNPSLLNEN